MERKQRFLYGDKLMTPTPSSQLRGIPLCAWLTPNEALQAWLSFATLQIIIKRFCRKEALEKSNKDADLGEGAVSAK